MYVGFAAAGKRFFKPLRNDNWCDFEDSPRELFLFAILLNRRELGKMMWKVGQDQLGTGCQKFFVVGTVIFYPANFGSKFGCFLKTMLCHALSIDCLLVK